MVRFSTMFQKKDSLSPGFISFAAQALSHLLCFICGLSSLTFVSEDEMLILEFGSNGSTTNSFFILPHGFSGLIQWIWSFSSSVLLLLDVVRSNQILTTSSMDSFIHVLLVGGSFDVWSNIIS